MRRVQFIEIHEQKWFPSSIRDEITDALQFGLNLLGAYAPVVPLLRGALDGGSSVVDLCSGGGGPWMGLASQLLAESPGMQVWLTDRHPNREAIRNVGTGVEGQVRFWPDSVDAMHVPGELKGFRTMFSSFHHFSEEKACAVLQHAIDAHEGIAVFEVTRRSPAAIVLMFPWALMTWVCTPWIRPFRWSRLVWTYLIPIIPLVLLFDGVVSCLRSYRPSELRQAVQKLSSNAYQWDVGELSTGKVPITYLIGCPKEIIP
jgi:hypothetical protein